MPHTLIFVDLPSPDPEASGRFYEAVFGWTVEGRPAGTFHRIVPGGEFPGPDGKDSGVGNLHLGIYSTANPVPDPNVPSTHRSEEHTSELQSLMRTPYAVFCLKKKKNKHHTT